MRDSGGAQLSPHLRIAVVNLQYVSGYTWSPMPKLPMQTPHKDCVAAARSTTVSNKFCDHSCGYGICVAEPASKSEYFARLKVRLFNNTQNYAWLLGTGDGVTTVTWQPGLPWKLDQSNAAVHNDAKSQGERKEWAAGAVTR